LQIVLDALLLNQAQTLLHPEEEFWDYGLMLLQLQFVVFALLKALNLLFRQQFHIQTEDFE
jgi:hypothetical protein